MMNLPADIQSNLRALTTTIKRNQTGLYSNAIVELVQLLIHYADSEIFFTSNATTALCSLITWLDNEVVEQCKVTDKPNPSSNIGLDLVDNLVDALRCSVGERETNKEEFAQDYDQTAINNASALDGEPDSIDGLLKQLALRRVEKLVPNFPEVQLTDSDDEEDNDVKIDEQSEHRMMKHGSQTTQQEVEKRQNGQEIRTKKVQTMNVSKSSKTITIKISGKGAEDLLKKFYDQKGDFNKDEDFEREVTFPCKQPGVLEDAHEEENSNDLMTKTKTVQHNATTLQAVSRQTKRNGRLKLEQSSQKLDLTDLNARQVDTYDGNQLVDRKGEGTLLESSVIQNRIGDQVEEWSILLPPRKHVEHYIKTIEEKDGEDSGNFFRATALESYIALNQHLIMFEEQQHRQINYSFGLTGTKAEAADFSFNLRHLTKSTDADDFVSPTIAGEYDEKTPKSSKLLSITEKAGILESLDVSDYLVFQDENKKEVRGGPCDALAIFRYLDTTYIVIYASHASSPSSSLLFQEAFITTFCGFVDAEELIKRLIHRYSYMGNLRNHEAVKAARQSFSMLIRVVDSLCYVELNPDLLKQLTEFMGKLLRSKCYNLVKVFRQRLSERLDECRRNRLFQLYKQPFLNPGTKTIFNMSSSSIAKQLTYLDSQLFNKIEIPEMIWWAADRVEQQCPNIQAMTNHFNNVSYWMRSKILEPESKREREKWFNKFLKVAKHLKKMNNLNGYLATLSALDSGPVRRLNWPQSFKDQIKSQVSIMDTRQSFKNYRTVLAQSKPPCLPYFGLILQDLTFVDLGNPEFLQHRTAKNLLNFGKRWQQYAILDNVRRFSRWSYSIEKDEKIISMFNDFEALSEEEAWRRSYELVPRSSSS